MSQPRKDPVLPWWVALLFAIAFGVAAAVMLVRQGFSIGLLIIVGLMLFSGYVARGTRQQQKKG